MGVFKIHPDNLSTITCSIFEDETATYQVVPSSIDMNEQERAMATQLGFVARGVVDIKFMVICFGTTQESAMSAFRALQRAVMDKPGGYIEYKPVGLGASVRSTFYRYDNRYAVSVPRIALAGMIHGPGMEKLARVNSASDYGISVEVMLKTFPWAMSDPDSAVTVKSVSGLDNYDDGTHDSSFVIDSSSDIIGDAILPIVRVYRTDADAANIRQVYVHVREALEGTSTNLDLIYADDFGTLNNFTLTAGAVPGGYYLTTSSSGAQATWTLGTDGGIDMDRTYTGKITPILLARVTGGSYYVKVAVAGVVSNQINSKTLTVSDTDWRFYIFDELDFPPFVIPDSIQEADVGDFMANVELKVSVTQISAGDFQFVWLWIPVSTRWIAKLESDGSSGQITQYDRLSIDAFTQQVYRFSNPSTPEFEYAWRKYGVNWAKFILRKGFDSRVRILCQDDDVYDMDFVSDITLAGYYLTVYPFEE